MVVRIYNQTDNKTFNLWDTFSLNFGDLYDVVKYHSAFYNSTESTLGVQSLFLQKVDFNRLVINSIACN